MVLEGDGVEDVLEHLVVVLVACVDAAVLVIELDGTGNGLEKSQWNVREVGIGLYPVILGPKKVLTLREIITTNKDRQFTDTLDPCMLHLHVCEFYYVPFSIEIE